jgi:hypothetical protein
MTTDQPRAKTWWLPRVRWLLLLLAAIVIPALAIPVYRHQSACRYVEQRGYLGAQQYEIGSLTIYWDVEEVYLKRGTLDHRPTPEYISLQPGDLARLRVFPGLRKLVIGGYELPDASMQELTSLRSLREIDAIRTNLSREQALKLSRELPDCSIRYPIDGDPRHSDQIRSL